MKILYILDPATIGGATIAFLSLVVKIKEKGVVPIVCTAQHSDLNNMLESFGIRTIVTGHREMFTTKLGRGFHGKLKHLKKMVWWFFCDVRAVKRISCAINMKEIDIIHTNSTRSDVGFLLAKRYRKHHIVHIREFGDVDYQCYPFNPFFSSFYNKYSSQYICVSNAVRNYWIKKGIDTNKALTIYDGIDYEKIRVSQDHDKKSRFLRLIMSGGIMPSKGQALAIKAIGMLPIEVKRNISIDLVGWCTDQYKNELMDLANKCALINLVNFVGVRDDVYSLLCNYDVGLMCSRSEGFGLVTAEFMFAKLGVIASNSGACPELIDNDITGILFNCGDEKSLSEAILKYYYNRDLIIKYSTAAREKALNCFTSKLNADKIYAKYCEFC